MSVRFYVRPERIPQTLDRLNPMKYPEADERDRWTTCPNPTSWPDTFYRDCDRKKTKGQNSSNSFRDFLEGVLEQVRPGLEVVQVGLDRSGETLRKWVRPQCLRRDTGAKSATSLPPVWV